MSGTPREVLAALLLEPLASSPCHVAFSGGRDSSAILAAATQVARTHGLPDPVPLTAVLEDFPRTRETEWQELVIGHLGLRHWNKVAITTQLDALGPVAAEALRRYGVFWPAQAHSIIVFSRHAGSGSIVTGGGGDEVFFPWSGRRSRPREIARLRPRRRAIKRGALYSLPRGVRSNLYRRRHPLVIPWLRPNAEAEVRQQWLEWRRVPARRWSDALDNFMQSRYLELVQAAMGTFSADSGVRLYEPFYDPRFARAIAATAPRDGFPSRTAAMETVFGDLLPRGVWTRGTKAVFTEVAWGSESRSFVESWDGAGVDEDLVDPPRLREEWTRPRPDARSLTCLQQAFVFTRSQV